MNVYFHNVSMDFEFYIPVGTGDITRCFFCGGRLKDWKKTDDPWIGHARYYGNCWFVRQCKGETFVKLVKQGKLLEATQLVSITISKHT